MKPGSCLVFLTSVDMKRSLFIFSPVDADHSKTHLQLRCMILCVLFC